MLTNNKKGLFVKGISMMLAVLMVLAVALTGCTDSDAQKKIEELQTEVDNKANKADVTTEVSAAIANALKDYLKTNDAVTEAAVKELINSSVADFAKKSDLNGLATTDALKSYVKSDEFNTLKNSLKNYVTSADVTKAIEAYVATEAFKQAVKNITGNSLSKDDIEQIVKDVLAEGKYTNEDYVKNAIDDTLKNYFGELDAETVLKILTEQKKQMDAKDSPMTEKEWNSATELVIATINSIQTTFSKIRSNVYTAANKAAINEAVKPLGITVFKADGTFANTAVQETKLIEYRILRVADVKEIQALKTAVEAAGAVESFADEWNKVVVRLYALGQYVNRYSNADLKDEHLVKNTGDNPIVYHGKSYAKGAILQTQVVTYADKVAFQTLSADIDKLLVKYGAEGVLPAPFTSKNKTPSSNGLKDIYKKEVKNGSNVTTSYVLVDSGTKKGGLNSPSNAPAVGTEANTTYTYMMTTAFYTLGGESELHYYEQSGEQVYFLNFNDILGTVTVGETYTKDYKDVDNGNRIKTDVGATITPAPVPGAEAYKEWVGAYDAIIAMLQACQTKVNTSNTKFQLFITDVLAAGMMDGSNPMAAAKKLTLPNTTLVARLTADMSEQPESGTPYTIYLTAGTSGAENVAKYVDAANAINNNYTDCLFRYDLYQQLIAKSNEALFPKYQAIALRVLDKMYNDFNSVVLAASQGVVGNAGGDIDVSSSVVDLTQLNTTNYTDTFLAAYVNAAGQISYQIGPKNIAFPGLKGLYANNEKANVLSDVNVQTSVKSDVLTTLKNNALTLSIELKASTVGVRAAINSKSAQDVADGSVKAMNAFDELLNQALANLNEVMYRYQVEDIKKAALNEMTAYAADRAVYYSTIDHAKAAPLTIALQQYLTGASAGASAGDPGVPGFTFNTTTVGGSTVTTVASKESNVFAGINNRAFYDQLAAITVNMSDSIDGVVIGTTGTQAYNAVMAAKAAVKATMENMSVKYNFNDYLDDASTNARMAMYSYTQLPAATWTYENILAFQAAYNETLGVLTIEQYNHNRNGIALEEYKTRYISKVLSAIVDKDDTHSVLVNGKATPADAFAEMLKAVKSSQPVPKAGATWATGPVRPIADFGTRAPATVSTEYLYAGSLVVALDKIANAKTTYTWTENGAVKTANLY